ncbi:solute:sodium symporter family transporter [Virgibacillus halophilus]|uniref:solute:sodium symporter family transporter n=1 Tax=Tigheibacillus halophilus TaxID=361280 RepID=UPI003634F272
MNLFAIVSFIIIIAAIWTYAYFRSRSVDIATSEGYFLGGRSLKGFTIAGTIIMANLSTEQIVGQNGQSYQAGMQVMAWEVTAAVAVVALALVFLPKYLKYGVDTISDFIEIRYDGTTRRIVSFLFMLTYMISFMPVVLYSGSLVFNKIFSIDKLLGVNQLTAVIVIATFAGIVGMLYLLIGGLSLSAFSDTIYGIGLLVAGLAVPIVGLFLLGKGDLLDGLGTIEARTPKLLNSIGAYDSEMVPWPALFTGMLFNNLFYWCTNQMIVQKTLAGKSLKEGQKGTLYVGMFKVISGLILVFPGIIAFNMFGDSLPIADDAYPKLVNSVLPGAVKGVFGAVFFGAILSSFVAALNATSTLFTIDFYRPLLKSNPSDKKVARAGKIVTIAVGVASIMIAPLISFAPSGLYNVVQQFNGVYSMPLLAVILFGFYSKHVTALAAKITFLFHVVVYPVANLLLDVNYLYILGAMFLLDVLLMWIISSIKPLQYTFVFEKDTNKVDLTPWKYAKAGGAIVILCVIGMYVLFSPLGLAG